MRLRETRQREVVDTSNAAGVGRVDGAVLQLDPPRVHALRLSKTKDGALLSWSDLTAIGPDAVTVPNKNVLREAVDSAEAAAADANRDLLDKPALSEFGMDLGTVLDAEVDPDTGALLSIVTDRGELDPQRLLGVGGYAAIFRDG
jgi:sporulation protein YlmC with PRC-barrel domain